MWRRMLIWSVSLLGGVVLSYLIALVRMPDAPDGLKVGLGIFMGVVLAVMFDLLLRDQEQAFGAVYLWDRHRAYELLTARARRKIRDVDPFGMAAMEILVGNADRGRARIAAEPVKVGPGARLRRCVEAQADLAFGDTAGARAALDELLAMRPFRTRPIERYRVALLARAAVAVTDAARRERVEALLRAHADEEARAFGTWLRADDPIDERDRLAESQRGAELATLHGFEVLATQLEDRAAAIGRRDGTAYRS